MVFKEMVFALTVWKEVVYKKPVSLNYYKTEFYQNLKEKKLSFKIKKMENK